MDRAYTSGNGWVECSKRSVKRWFGLAVGGLA